MLVFLKFCTALVAVHIMDQFLSGALHCTADIALPFIYGIYLMPQAQLNTSVYSCLQGGTGASSFVVHCNCI